MNTIFFFFKQTDKGMIKMIIINYYDLRWSARRQRLRYIIVYVH